MISLRKLFEINRNIDTGFKHDKEFNVRARTAIIYTAPAFASALAFAVLLPTESDLPEPSAYELRCEAYARQINDDTLG